MYCFVQCPICSLFLNPGMSMEEHLQTHPMDTIINALSSLIWSSTSNVVVDSDTVLRGSPVLIQQTNNVPFDGSPDPVDDSMNDQGLEEPSYEASSRPSCIVGPPTVIKSQDPLLEDNSPEEQSEFENIDDPEENNEDTKMNVNTGNQLFNDEDISMEMESVPSEETLKSIPEPEVPTGGLNTAQSEPNHHRPGFTLISNVKLTPAETKNIQKFISTHVVESKPINKSEILPCPVKNPPTILLQAKEEDVEPTIAVVTSVIRRAAPRKERTPSPVLGVIQRNSILADKTDPIPSELSAIEPTMVNQNEEPSPINPILRKPIPMGGNTSGRKVIKVKLKPFNKTDSEASKSCNETKTVEIPAINNVPDLDRPSTSKEVKISPEDIEMQLISIFKEELMKEELLISNEERKDGNFIKEETLFKEDPKEEDFLIPKEETDKEKLNIINSDLVTIKDDSVLIKEEATDKTGEIAIDTVEIYSDSSVIEIPYKEEEEDKVKNVEDSNIAINEIRTIDWIEMSGPSTSKPTSVFYETSAQHLLDDNGKMSLESVQQIDTILENSISSESCYSQTNYISYSSGLYGPLNVNIRTDEQMPAKGEISEQESNADLDTPWNIKQDVFEIATTANSHDTNAALESWNYGGNEVKTENLNFNFLNQGASDKAGQSLPSSYEKSKQWESSTTCTYIKGKMYNAASRPTKYVKSYACFSCPRVFRLFRLRKEHMLEEHKDLVRTANCDSKSKLLPVTNLSALDIEVDYRSDLPNGLTIPNLEVLLKYPRKLNRMLLELNLKIYSEKQVVSEVTQDLIMQFMTSRRYFCMECGEQFPLFNSYKKHLAEHSITCYACDRSYKNALRFSRHMRQHLGIFVKYPCSQCSRTYSSKKKLQLHKMTHSTFGHKCNHCKRTFMHYSRMLEHKRQKHFSSGQPKKKEYLCRCGEVFHTQAKFVWHQEIHDRKPKTCPFCRERFVHKNSLSRHMRLAHMERYSEVKKDSIECPVCHKTYIKSSYKPHMATHISKPTYECTICNKVLSTKWNLKMHRWTHNNRSSMPFKCTLCPKAFTRSNDLETHLLIHKSIKPYTCDHCGCQFAWKYNWMRHQREHEKEKNHKCNICQKAFHRAYYLKEHIRSHTNERPFECSICGKTSATKTNHNKHLKIHHARDIAATEG